MACVGSIRNFNHIAASVVVQDGLCAVISHIFLIDSCFYKCTIMQMFQSTKERLAKFCSTSRSYFKTTRTELSDVFRFIYGVKQRWMVWVISVCYL